ncbi:MAG: ABC transporter ATP-binding protein [Alphaproteobacteria bacterium]
MTAALSLRHVAKRFPGGIAALEDVSFDVAESEFFAVLGGGGAGKTTLLRLIAGLDAPTSGDMLLFGQGAQGRGAGVRPVSLMFQSQALFPHLTAAENVAYGLHRGRRMPPETREMVDGLMVLTGLAGRANAKPETLDEPLRRRLAFARSLARRPRILLLDAPTAGLDDRPRAALQRTIAEVQRSTGLTVVLATDDPDEAVMLADRIAVIEAGSIAEVGTPDALGDRPATRAAARLVGRMNLLEARLEGGGASLVIAGLGRRQVRGWPGRSNAVTVGIPPDAIRLTRSPSDRSTAEPAFVRGQAFLGGRRCLLVEAAAGATLIAVAPAERLAEGDAVWLDWDVERAVVLEG